MKRKDLSKGFRFTEECYSHKPILTDIILQFQFSNLFFMYIFDDKALCPF